MSSTEPSTGLASDIPIELREGYADVGDVRLHYVEAGDGPLIVLLHGFPEFWYGWRRQIAPLAAAGFRVVAPDASTGREHPSAGDARSALTDGTRSADLKWDRTDPRPGPACPGRPRTGRGPVP